MRLGFIIMSQRIKLESPVGRAWVPEAKEVQDATICWQGDGHSILGRKRRYYVGLFTQVKYNNWSVLCKLVRPAENHHREKRRGKLSKGVLLQKDNARVHTCKVAMDAVERNGYELIPHPAYSPDLAPSYFFLFPNLKKISVDFISGLMKKSSKRLTSIVHILSPETDNCLSWISGRERMTVENISWSISTKECCRPRRRGLNPRPPGLQSDGASNWATEAGEHRWSKCITIEGNYIEKEEVDLNRK